MAGKRTAEGVAPVGFIPAAEYGAIHARTVIACVDLVLVYRKGALLVRRENEPAKGQWFLPGGVIRRGEYRIDAAKRKAKEELGLDVSVLQELETGETLFPTDPFGHGKGTHTVSFAYLAVPARRQQIRQSAESSAWVAVTPSTYPRYKKGLHPYVARCLEKAFGEHRKLFK